MNFNEIINQFRNRRILVIGDLMLDKEIIGETNRISPEAPVQIVNVKEEKFILGGAGNVANNLKNLGAKVFVVGVVGDDEYGRILISKFKNERINIDCVKVVNDRPTTQKNRIICQNQQLIRIDYEERKNIDEKIGKEILDYFSSIVERIDGVVISDYAKGVLTKNVAESIIKSCNENKKPVIVDPKPVNIEKFKDATLLTPNLKEAKEISGLEDLEEIGKDLINKYNASILITRGKDGMSLFLKDKRIDIKADVKEVYDVTGAGDTVVSILSLALASGADLEKACKIANYAAGIVIGKLGTSVILKDELLNIGKNGISKKIKKIEELKNIISDLKRKGKKIVFTNGAFDLLHIGHVKTLEKAKSFGDVLVVGLNDDEYIRKHKGKNRPIFNEKERAEMLSALDYVDYVIIFREDTVIRLLNEIKPDVHVKGGTFVEWRVKEEKELVESYGGKMKMLEQIGDLSSTSTIERIFGRVEKNKVVFLDRDGVINEDSGFVYKIEDFKFIPRSVDGLRLLGNYKLFVVTNQSGVGCGYYTEEDMHKFNEYMINELRKEDISLDRIYYCLHHPEKGIGEYKVDCDCRKPKSGMFKKAAEEHNVDLGMSWVIGDKMKDITAGKNVGCKTILVRTGYGGKERGANSSVKPDFVVDDLYEAAKLILREDGKNF